MKYLRPVEWSRLITAAVSADGVGGAKDRGYIDARMGVRKTRGVRGSCEVVPSSLPDFVTSRVTFEPGSVVSALAARTSTRRTKRMLGLCDRAATVSCLTENLLRHDIKPCDLQPSVEHESAEEAAQSRQKVTISRVLFSEI